MAGARGGRQGPVTAERVLDAALCLIDAEGLDALTMRRLARDLGVTPVTIYRQIPSREAILTGVAERLWHDLRPAAESVPNSAGWQAQIAAMWLGLHAVMQAHPNAIPLLAKAGAYSSSAADGMVTMAGVLHDAGLTPDEAAEQLHLLSACTVGFGFAKLWDAQHARGEWPEKPAGPLIETPPPELRPYLERMAVWDPSEFPRALATILGLARGGSSSS